jgi:cysteine desulfuration protein SufE
MSIAEKETEIIESFSLYDDWMEKYEHLISFAKQLPVIDSKYKTEEYLVRGCQSRVWLHADFIEGKVFFTADSDAIITKGIVGLLIYVLSGESPDDIINAKMDFIDTIGLKEHLTPNRSNGLVSMIKLMKAYSAEFKSLKV